MESEAIGEDMELNVIGNTKGKQSGPEDELLNRPISDPSMDAEDMYDLDGVPEMDGTATTAGDV